MQQPFQAVLFDLDGTLLDTLADLGNCMNSVLRQSGYPQHPLAAYKAFVGDGLEMLVRRVLPAAEVNDTTVAAISHDMQREYGARWAEHTVPYPGIEEMLRALVRQQVPLCVLSNKPHQFTALMVDHFFPDIPFAAVRGAQPAMPRKPAPDGALALARSLDIAPRNWLYLGDTNTDMQTAQAAAMFGIGVLWGFRDRGELQASGARQVINRPGEILRYFSDRTVEHHGND